MALVSMRELLDHAAENGYGIPAFNVNNLEQVQAVMTAADEVGAPGRTPAGVPLLGLCFGISAMLLVRPTRAGGWQKLDRRSFVLPPVLLVGGGAIAFVAQFAISFVRPEPTFWTAYPQALNIAIFAGVSLIGGLALARRGDQRALQPLGRAVRLGDGGERRAASALEFVGIKPARGEFER